MKKINWKFGVVSAVAAGLMLASVPGVALAATVDTDQTIDKTWNVDSTFQYSPDERFTFELTYAGAEQVGTNTLQNFSTFGTKTASLTTSGSELQYTGQAQLDELFSGVEFTQPGVYYFELCEQQGTNNSITYSDAVYTVQVSVVWNDDFSGVKIAQVNLATGAYGSANFDIEESTKTNSAAFTNTTGEKARNTLTVTKKVAGTAANTSDVFSFEVKLSGLQPGYTYDVEGADDVTADEDGNATIEATLSHNDPITVNNLPDGATWTVTETDAKGYDTTVTDNGKTLESETDSIDSDNQKASGAMGHKDTDSVLFTNEKGFMPQTGITMNTLPYVGVGVVAAAGAMTLVISRKRRAGEDF